MELLKPDKNPYALERAEQGKDASSTRHLR